jgi:hypothetical protein
MNHISIKQILKYIDNTLKKEDEQVINSHLDICEQCRNNYNFHIKIEGVLHDFPLSHTSDNFVQNTLNKIPKKQYNFFLSFILKPQILLNFITLLLSISIMLFSAIKWSSEGVFNITNTFNNYLEDFNQYLFQIKNQVIQILVLVDNTPAARYLFIIIVILIILEIFDILLDRKSLKILKQ